MLFVLVIALVIAAFIGAIVNAFLYFVSIVISLLFAEKEDEQEQNSIQSLMMFVFAAVLLVSSLGSCSHGNTLQKEATKFSNHNYTEGSGWVILGIVLLVTAIISGCIAVCCRASTSNEKN